MNATSPDNTPMADRERAWRHSRDALAAEVDRVTELLRSLPAETPQRHAVGSWSLIEVAVHLSQAWIAVPGLARADLSGLDPVLPQRAGPSVVGELAQLDEATVRAVAAEPERDPAVLADRIAERARDYLAQCPRQDPARRLPWLINGVTVPVPVFTGHLLGETVVHGWDIARAAGRPWRIEPAHAALVIQEFLMPVLLAAGTRMFDDPARLAAARGRYEMRVRGSDSIRLVLDDAGGHLDTDPGRPDCTMSFDPVAFLLMFFGRLGLPRIVLRRGVLVWGRRPWLALRLRTAMPHP